MGLSLQRYIKDVRLILKRKIHTGLGWGHAWFILHFLFINHKNGKITRTSPILKSNSTSFSSDNCVPKVYNKKNHKNGGQKGSALNFLGSIAVLTDIIEILLTPCLYSLFSVRITLDPLQAI